MNAQTHEAYAALTQIVEPKRRLSELLVRLERIEELAPRLQLLFACLADPYPAIRQLAARTLSQLQPLDEPYIELLVDLSRGAPRDVAHGFLPPDAPEVRLAALAALRGTPHPALATLYLTLSQSGDPDVRYQCLLNLFDLHTPIEEEPLLEALSRGLSDRDAEVAVIAAQFAAERDLHALHDAIWRRHQETPAHAHQIRLQLALALSRLYTRGEQGAAAPCESLPSERVEALLQDLERGLRDEEASAASGEALVDLALTCGQRERAMKTLQQILSKWLLHPLLKVEAAAQLTRLGDARGLSYLSDAIDGRRKDTRGHALGVAGRLKIEPLYGQVARVARDWRDYHNDTAIVALANYGSPQAHGHLEQIIEAHPDPAMRRLAERALRAPQGASITFFSLDDELFDETD